LKYQELVTTRTYQEATSTNAPAAMDTSSRFSTVTKLTLIVKAQYTLFVSTYDRSH